MRYKVLDWPSWVKEHCAEDGTPDAAGRAALLGACKHYMSGLQKFDDAMDGVRLQEYTSASDFPAPAREIIVNHFEAPFIIRVLLNESSSIYR